MVKKNKLSKLFSKSKKKQPAPLKNYKAKKKNIENFYKTTSVNYSKSSDTTPQGLLEIIKDGEQATEVLYGLNSVKMAIKAGKRTCKKLLLAEEITTKNPKSEILQIKRLAIQRQIPIKNVKKKILSQAVNDENHQGVALIASFLPFYDFTKLTKNKIIKKLIALDHVQGPQNMGAIIRSACYFGFDGMILTNDKSAPINAKVSKASAGLLEFFNIYKTPNMVRALNELKKNNFWIVAADLDGDNIYNFSAPDKFILLMGNEKKGIRPIVKKNSDFVVTIPGKLLSESLNVSVAAGVLMSTLVNNKQK